jgi:sensor histidine kinase YesM
MRHPWLELLGINLAASLLAVAVFGEFDAGSGWRDIAEAFGYSLLFANCIGVLIGVVIPRAGARLRHLPAALYWAALVPLLIGIAAVGSMIALTVLSIFGAVNPRDVLAVWLGGSLRISIIVTLVFGIFGTVLGISRARLEAAELALRTRERDEAEARRLAAEAQVASLESRVHPHFLFNTLNSIAALIHEDPKGAEKMTGQLASLLRSSLDSAGTPLVPLEQELRTVRDYLDIERVRFGGRLRCALDVDPAAHPALVPRFSLQTLVENAVKYAVSPRREGGAIAVRARAAAGRVRLEVEDDGPGFDAGEVPPHHGLAVVRARLALTFGERASMDIRSTPGRTVIAIEVPR